MLPDLRVLLLATVTTFLLATGVGLYASVRLLPEPLAAVHPDRDTPISRVAVSWQDMTNAPARDITPAMIQRDAPVDSTDTHDSVAPARKSDDRPTAAPVAEDSAPPAAADESIASKSEPAPPTEPAKGEPATTGAIGETPSAPAISRPPRFAARPEPIEATTHVDTRHIAAPVTHPKVKTAKPEPRKLRRARVARRPLSQDGSPVASGDSNGNGNFFTEFGSRMNR
jgi:hypothetical protein